MKLGMDKAQKDIPELNIAGPELEDILDGKIVGRNICHQWSVEGEVVFYSGSVKKSYKNKNYKIGYWGADESSQSAVDYFLSAYEFAADFLNDELVLS